MNTQTISKDNTSPSGRIYLLDILRAIAIILMVLYHIMYDLAFLFPVPFFTDLYFKLADTNLLSAVPFIFISGISSRLSRSNAKRGAKLLLIAACFTAVTVFIMPSAPIYSGILHMMAISMLAVSVFEDFFKKIPIWVGIAACSLLFAFTLNIQNGYLGFQDFLYVQLPEHLYESDLLYVFGFHSENFSSSDYWPVFPWIFLFFAGAFAGGFIEKYNLPEWTRKNFCPALSFIGRHSLKIYILHQPVIFVVLWLIIR